MSSTSEAVQVVCLVFVASVIAAIAAGIAVAAIAAIAAGIAVDAVLSNSCCCYCC